LDASITSLEGLQPSKQTPFKPLGTKLFFTGLVTNRNPLLQPGSRAEFRFYGGRPDSLIGGSNVEVSVRNTLVRRPGHSLFNTLSSPAIGYYCFRAPLQTPAVMADTATAVYQVASSGSPTLIMNKSASAGQTTFQGVGPELFMANGVDLKKWNGTALTNWGIAAPAAAPTLAIKGGAPPASPSLSTTAGGTLTGQGTFYVRTTFVTPFGETTGSAEAYVAVPDNNEMVVAYPSSPPSNATGWNCYVGRAAGGETLQNTSPIALTTNWTQTAMPTIGTAAPPGSSSGNYTITSTLGVSYVFCYTNTNTAHVSTASPISAYTGPQTDVQIEISGIGSNDPQVNEIQIYRTTDGGATYYLLATVENSANWTYTDTGTPDADLNTEVIAPQALANNPPPTGLTAIAFFDGCMWGAVGSYLYYSGGPNTTNGSGNEAWPPLNYSLLPSAITRLVPFPNGMLIFTVDDLWVVTGAGATPSLFQAGLGCLNYNSIDVNGSNIVVFTSDRNLTQITPGAGVVDLGANIADQFYSWNPAQVSLAYFIYGYHDNAVFVCNGSGGFFRCNPNQGPEGGATWSPLGTIAAGASVMSSIETTAGVHQLLVSSGDNILYRDWTQFTDHGTAYSANATIGSLVFTMPGQLCQIEFITLQAVKTGTQPALSVLLGEISGTFETLATSVNDPPLLPPSNSLYSVRYYLNQSTAPVVCQHLQLNVGFNSDTVQNELLAYSLYGALIAE
jgi:hypothetical protein